MAKSSWMFTLEDTKASFALFCCVFGIGTLGMPANFARAGPLFGSLALVLMAVANIYGAVALSRVMLLAPRTVKTYTDLGEWAMGRTGRYMALCSQMGVCLMMPCAFLVLGSMLFETLFPNTFSQIFWIIFMALMVCPVALIPTMKEGAGMMLAGCLGTVIADVIGISVLMHNMSGHPAAPAPAFSVHEITTTFGNLALAYGAAIVIPDLQRDHNEPHRMPRVVFTTLMLITVCFLALAVLGYLTVGCQLAGNLLFAVAGDSGGETALGFVANRGSVVMAYLFMQLHIAIAFSTLLHPAFFMIERLVLGMHKHTPGHEEILDRVEKQSYVSTSTPNGNVRDSASMVIVGERLESIKPATTAAVAPGDEPHDELAEYRGKRNTIRYILARLVTIAILVAASVALKDHFLELADFIGASAHSTSCIILPLLLHLKVNWRRLPLYERAGAIFLIVISAICAVYVMIQTGKVLFGGDDETAKFPFCPAEHKETPYYIKGA